MSRFEVLADQVAAVLDVDEAIIDGEVIAVDETGRPQFYELLRVPRSASYVAFDILWLNGADLRSLPLRERRRRLRGILPKGSPIVSEALSVAGRGHELFELMCANDLEGIVVKRLADPYSGRVRWLNIKNPDYSQKEGRGDLFNGPRQRTARTAGSWSRSNAWYLRRESARGGACVKTLTSQQGGSADPHSGQKRR